VQHETQTLPFPREENTKEEREKTEETGEIKKQRT
jgi:hypothetical protein